MRVWYTVSWCIWLLVIFLWLLSRPVLVAPCISKELLGQLCSHGLKGTKMNTKTKSASQWNLSGSVARWTVKGAVMHAIHSGVFSGTKQKSQKLRVELTAKKTHPENFNRPKWPTKTSSFLPSKGIKEKGSPMVTRNRIRGPRQSNPIQKGQVTFHNFGPLQDPRKPEGFQTYREG